MAFCFFGGSATPDKIEIVLLFARCLDPGMFPLILTVLNRDYSAPDYNPY